VRRRASPNPSEEQFVLSSEREMLSEEDESKLGERMPFDSSRQATYEDSVPTESEWNYEDSQ
jgi:hypothetical protein